MCSLWKKIKLHTNTDFSVIGCMLYVITNICKDAKYNSDIDHRKQVNNLIKTFFRGLSEDGITLIKTCFGLSTPCLIKIMIFLW